LAKQRGDEFMELEEQYAGYEVYDRRGEKIGKVDDLFVDENDKPEYIGVKMGFLGMKSTLIPIDMARIDEGARRIEVSVDKAKAKEGPAFDDDEEITPEYENRVRNHYGLGSAQEGAAERGAYGGYYPDRERDTHDLDRERGTHDLGRERETHDFDRERGAHDLDRERDTHDLDRERGTYAGRREGTEEHPGAAMDDIDRERGEFREHPPSPEHKGVTEQGDDLEGEDELRVQRTEEELRADTREREAGAMRVRKRVRTEREQVRVPKKREEVHVDRVPVEGREAPEAEIGDDEVVMPVTEEEVVTEKRPVVKEEIRLRKDVTEDEEVVEEDVRKEEIDIDDQTGHRGGALGRDTDIDDETRRRNR
jgi:uncharacterized protein (TIGR02271 family)